MIYEKLLVEGCYLFKRNIPKDERGYFSRIADVNEIKKTGLNAEFVQISASRNYKKGTLRGMHMQIGTSAEEKYISCVEGEVYDVCLDLRKTSPTYLKYCSAVLSEENGYAIYIPKGCAHGFVSLRDNSQLIYFMTNEHDKQAERGYLWSDPAFSIDWPILPEVISDRDNNWPLYEV
ncbi:dTDP-4-dehydrorhamnose 3,5-epimerase RfbC1 [Butyrivibrio proteoclasticus B316]|uniref:dTDP-4-dehydrorhamnose 3,5-epimerase RfbC1 n=1 Tax=Butyrivibrio proteoclasticus (strain ATCC 51982 / DSM 14932 / B316) TaxID=515622 RepID=E0S226_BUTPB|nr:dTDP-4-dehydrorhamnose 3,5-epimerase family protein [Butyrivibrio proteoclasticus]ADL33851.1 dTDP-4-dehydrorhamnose 3,5-epimerase RfbC1 [Butyrivibrio proteoclasticus B316]